MYVFKYVYNRYRKIFIYFLFFKYKVKMSRFYLMLKIIIKNIFLLILEYNELFYHQKLGSFNINCLKKYICFIENKSVGYWWSALMREARS